MLESDPQRIKHCVPNPAREKLRPHRTVAVTQPQTGFAAALRQYRSYEPATRVEACLPQPAP